MCLSEMFRTLERRMDNVSTAVQYHTRTVYATKDKCLEFIVYKERKSLTVFLAPLLPAKETSEERASFASGHRLPIVLDQLQPNRDLGNYRPTSSSL